MQKRGGNFQNTSRIFADQYFDWYIIQHMFTVCKHRPIRYGNGTK